MAQITKEEAYIVGAAQKRFREEYQKKKRARKIRGNILWALFLIFFSILMFNMGFIVFEYHGTGMSNTCSDGDIVITNRLAFFVNEPERGEIITIKTDDGYDLKRVIGLPGDEINFSNGDIYINGSRCIETYISGDTESEIANITVDEGSYFVLNDDREDTNDSRKEAYYKTSVRGAEIMVIHVPDIVKENTAYQSIRNFFKSGAEFTRSIEESVETAMTE